MTVSQKQLNAMSDRFRIQFDRRVENYLGLCQDTDPNFTNGDLLYDMRLQLEQYGNDMNSRLAEVARKNGLPFAPLPISVP